MRHWFPCLRRQNRARDLDEEIRAHLAIERRRRAESGETPEEAERNARLDFGNVGLVKDVTRDTWGWNRTHDLLQDLGYALRTLARNRGFTATAVLTLMIVIGANTAVFSVVYGVLLRPLPYEEPEQLVALSNGISASKSDVLNEAALERLRATSQSFQGVSGFLLTPVILDMEGPVAQDQLVRVSSDFFSALLRVHPILGRNFTLEDERAEAPPVAVISHEFWQTHFGADPNVLGRQIRFRAYPSLEVVGVLPPGLRSPSNLGESPSIWSLLGSGPPPSPFGDLFPVFGRLKPGITLEQAQVEMATIQTPIAETGDQRIEGHDLQLLGLADRYSTTDSRTRLLVFLGAALCLLLVGVSNLVSLELAHLTELEGEMSVRAALGASRWRLVRLVLIKSSVVGLAGGSFGTLLATAMNGVMLAYLPLGFPRSLDIRVDVDVYLYSTGLIVFSTLVIAIVPAIRGSRLNLSDTINGSARAHTDGRSHRILLNGLAASQTAVALVLVVAASLLIHSFWRLISVDLGFDSNDVVAVRVQPPDSYRELALETFLYDSIERLGKVDEIGAIAISSTFPMRVSMGGTIVTADADGEPRELRLRYAGVSGGYFETLRIPVLDGRTFTFDQSRNDSPVAMVSASAAQALWPGQSPLGKRLTPRCSDDCSEVTVVGLVGDTASSPFSTDRDATVYFTSSYILRKFGDLGGVFITARTSLPAVAIAQMIADAEPRSLVHPEAMDAILSMAVQQQRFETTVLTVFAVIVLLIAALGVYTVLTHSVARRTRELGVRMAFGAPPFRLFLVVLWDAILPSAIGLVFGLITAYALREVLTSYLFEIRPSDAPTYAIATSVLSFIFFVAAAIPAHRASRIDPMSALRHP